MEPLIYDLSSPGRVGAVLPESDVPHTPLPEGLLRAALPLPEVSQIDVTRHFTRLSRLNMGIDTNMYPLGSCTMKYNPRINEDTARMAGFALAHPLQDPDVSQGAMYVLYQLQQFLAEIAGMAGCSLQPAAGAQGEFTGVLMMRAYHRARGDHKRTRMLIPDSAHGTNPATCTMAGLKVVELPSDARGNIDLDALKANLDDTICGLMITNPNTLGMFEEHVEQVVQLVHAAGGLVYGDGANMNAMVGVCKPGEIGFDVLHYNLHKTFSTPHGGGGPGSGPVVGAIDLRIPQLRGAMDDPRFGGNFKDFNEAIHWVIAGGESGGPAEPSHPDWFRSLRDQCAAARVPLAMAKRLSRCRKSTVAGTPTMARGRV